LKYTNSSDDTYIPNDKYPGSIIESSPTSTGLYKYLPSFNIRQQ
jgi:hypothetical protein